MHVIIFGLFAALVGSLELADVNKDNIITKEEAKTYIEKTINERQATYNFND